MTFKPGDKVVCIYPITTTHSSLVKGQSYKVVAYTPKRLQGYKDSVTIEMGYEKETWWAWRFMYDNKLTRLFYDL